jgi:tripartite-type tricarboxylate transporter receptor subunit TctC
MLGSVAAIATPGLMMKSAQAQAFPSRPITFICPWPAGGTSDATMRVLAQMASKDLGQTIVVENRAGAAGMIGAKALASAKPDGYTIGQLALSVTRFSQLGTVQIDPIQDLRPVCPNCHAMLHRSKDLLSIEALQKFIRSGQS